MEKVRLIAMGLKVCRWYLIAFHILFALWVFLVLASLMDDTGIRAYCIYAAEGEPYDFMWGNGTRCRIEWRFFYGAVLPMFAVIYGVFCGPVWLGKFVLGRFCASSRV